MQLYVARHAQSTYNVLHRLNSDPTVAVPLTKLGLKQAHILAEKLAQAPFEAIYISELPRTKQTADIINEQHTVPIHIDGRLNDHNTGYEGRPAYEYLHALKLSRDRWHARFNNGESLEAASNRTAAFLRDLQTKHYQSVLVVTHGYIMEAMYGIIEGVPYEKAAKMRFHQGVYVSFEI
jgi:broad specificity phosphatase PhoE